ncbi:hypothetical protein HanPI659440_Chr06g0248031 [Helianthus annuus]|nr:hypothetical protein HanPI659440_Chr06g0248031 [Helianthus annuus]
MFMETNPPTFDVILEDDLSSASDLHATTVNSCSENICQENGSSYNPNHQNYFAHPPPSQSQPLIKKKKKCSRQPRMVMDTRETRSNSRDRWFRQTWIRCLRIMTMFMLQHNTTNTCYSLNFRTCMCYM